MVAAKNARTRSILYGDFLHPHHHCYHYQVPILCTVQHFLVLSYSIA
jgi:hypothetical protein